MIHARETFRDLCAYGLCTATAVTGLCACTPSASSSAMNNTNIDSPQQNAGMEEIVVTASRHSNRTD